MSALDIQQIQALLPHRYPFLMVDRIVEVDDVRIVGIKNVSYNEPHFVGHFPQFAVMPGVLIIEAMAQTAGVLVIQKLGGTNSKLVLLASIEEAKFRRPVVPGDQLRMEMHLEKLKPSIAKVRGQATVDGVVVAEAQILCKLADRPANA